MEITVDMMVKRNWIEDGDIFRGRGIDEFAANKERSHFLVVFKGFNKI